MAEVDIFNSKRDGNMRTNKASSSDTPERVLHKVGSYLIYSHDGDATKELVKDTNPSDEK